MSAQTIGRNDPCWCGSGKKFKKCHLDRQATAQLPFAAIKNQVERRWNEKRCLHALASPTSCDRIVSAHTVQRSGVLNKLVDASKHVKTFYRAEGDAPRTIGWRDASTFPGFCGRHDSSTFRPLETETFAATAEQCFLVGYRALCHEIHQKRASLRTSPLIRELGDRGYDEETQRRFQSVYAAIEAGTRKGLSAFEALKTSMDQQLVTSDYSQWNRLVVQFRGDLCVASTGVVSPNRDLDERELQTLHDPDPTKQETLLYGVVATPTGGAVVALWPRCHSAPKRFIESLLARGVDALPSLLVQFMFAFVENTYFSPAWWASLADVERKHVITLAHTWNAYYAKVVYKTIRLVPWQVTEVRLDDA